MHAFLAVAKLLVFNIESVLHKQNQSIDDRPTHTMCNFRAPLHAVFLHQVASTNCGFCHLLVVLLLLSSHRCCRHGWCATDVCCAKTHQQPITMSPSLPNYYGNCNCNWGTCIAPILEDRGRITESIRILVPVDRMKQKCFHITMKQVRWLQQ